jgi:hypothetical protein
MNKQALLGIIVICILILGVLLIFGLKHKSTPSGTTPSGTTPSITTTTTTTSGTTNTPTPTPPLTIFATTTPAPPSFPSNLNFLFNHPNDWSANPNQVMYYSDRNTFLASSFYNNYSSKLISIPDTNTIIPKHVQYRIVFMTNSFSDTTGFYLDNATINDYINVLYACQQNGFIPLELNAQKITTFTLPNRN